MTWTLGASTKTTILKSESHKLFNEFEVSGDVHRGQPVVLDATTGKIKAASANEDAANIIGISIHEGSSAFGDTVVVMMKAFAIVLCTAKSTVEAGPVEYAGFDDSTAYPGNQESFKGHNQVQPLTTNATSLLGWALAPTSAGEEVEVAIAG